MAEAPIFVSRVLRLPLLDAEGIAIGRIGDLVLAPSSPGDPPKVLGFVGLIQRRQIFLNANRIGEIESSGVRLKTGTVDLRRFSRRQGELLATELLDRQVGGEVVNDLALAVSDEGGGWVVATVSLSSARLLGRRRAGRVVRWTDLPTLFDSGPIGRAMAEIRGMHPAEAAAAMSELSPERRRVITDALDDERLADLLEELPEEDQVELIESLDIERAADVLEEMEADDAADLLAELPVEERNQLLAAMEPDDASDLRRLLTHQANTAGGLMNPEPLIVTPDTTVAEVLARIREPDVPVSLAAQVFVVESPTETPTGRYLGAAGFQRLLRQAPSARMADCLDPVNEQVPPEMTEGEVARRLATYDAIAVPVVDAAGRLLGAVTVDDVLDRTLPTGWRSR